MKIRVGELSMYDVFMWQSALYLIVNDIRDEEQDDIEVRRLCTFWPHGRGGGTAPTWVWTDATTERFKSDCYVETVNFAPENIERDAA